MYKHKTNFRYGRRIHWVHKTFGFVLGVLLCIVGALSTFGVIVLMVHNTVIVTPTLTLVIFGICLFGVAMGINIVVHNITQR